jgi:hypothetical protein
VYVAVAEHHGAPTRLCSDAVTAAIIKNFWPSAHFRRRGQHQCSRCSDLLFPFPLLLPLSLLLLYGSPIRSTYRGGKEGEKGIGDHCICCNGHHAATVYSLRPVDPSRASFFRLAASHRLNRPTRALVYALLRLLPPAAARAHGSRASCRHLSFRANTRSPLSCHAPAPAKFSATSCALNYSVRLEVKAWPAFGNWASTSSRRSETK